jgi:hypothetical protein
MFGLRYIKFQPGEYVLQYRNGKVVRQGAGLSFTYYAPNTSLSKVPVGSEDVPFIFEEVTADFQSVTVQGQIAYRIVAPQKVTGLLNYALDARGRNYISEDPKKLPERIINLVRVLTKKELDHMSLKEAITSNERLAQSILTEIRQHEMTEQFGLEILGFSILAVLPTKETARALEAQTREQILKQADEAIYERRNASIEQERRVRENEFNTEIAVETKRRQVKETQLEAERAVQQKKNLLKEEQLRFQTEQEEKKRELVDLTAQNARAEADAKAYELTAVMRSLEGVEPGVIQSLASVGMQPSQLIALAFQGLAGNAEKIGQLNISPDLLQELTRGAR